MGKIMEILRKRSRFSTPRETLRSLYVNRGQDEIADILGVDQTTVSDAMRRLRVTARPRRTPAPKGFVAQELTRRGRTTRRSAAQMFEFLYRTQGKSLQEIADILGTSRSLVNKFASDRNIELRQQGRPRGSKTTSRTSSFIPADCI